MTTESTETKPEPVTTKQVREIEVVQSDRMGLIAEANKFVDAMIFKQAAPAMFGTQYVRMEYSAEETRTLNAALAYLERQFNFGHRESEVYDKRSEIETK